MASEERARTVFAKAVLREVPLSQLASYIGHLGAGPVAIGDACGNGCGSGCGNGCARAIDIYGHTELTVNQLNAVLADKLALRKELGQQIDAMRKVALEG
jgi:hypothetical protein